MYYFPNIYVLSYNIVKKDLFINLVYSVKGVPLCQVIINVHTYSNIVPQAMQRNAPPGNGLVSSCLFLKKGSQVLSQQNIQSKNSFVNSIKKIILLQIYHVLCMHYHQISNNLSTRLFVS